MDRGERRSWREVEVKSGGDFCFALEAKTQGPIGADVLGPCNNVAWETVHGHDVGEVVVAGSIERSIYVICDNSRAGVGANPTFRSVVVACYSHSWAEKRIQMRASSTECPAPEPVWVSSIALTMTAYFAILEPTTFSRVLPRQLKREMSL